MSDTLLTSAYTIQPGDCLSKLAQKYHTTVDALLVMNPQYLLSPDNIQAGDTLKIPELHLKKQKILFLCLITLRPTNRHLFCSQPLPVRRL